MIEIDHHPDIVAWSAMARIAVSRTMPIPQQRVWEAVADLGSHPDWMRDAESLAFIGDQRRGVGTRMRVKTMIGPLRTVDLMEVTGWVEGRWLEVAHQGLVTGHGRVSVEAENGGTSVRWEEELVFPWWLGGVVTAWLARPLLAAVWRGNLRRLEETLT
jgi:hypothetical protein